tara:strand:- start:186 stop:374 length:189 start_codon:yes stop_codon:yes gene_type:complete
MKVADLVRLSKKAQRQRQNRHIAWDDIGFVCKEMSTDKLYYVKWFNRTNETLHYRYELKRAK